MRQQVRESRQKNGPFKKFEDRMEILESGASAGRRDLLLPSTGFRIQEG